MLFCVHGTYIGDPDEEGPYVKCQIKRKPLSVVDPPRPRGINFLPC